MKKLKSLLLMTAMLLTAFSLTSCDDDNIARHLDGIWRGKVVSEFWSWRGYEVDCQYVEIEFYKDPYTYSSGSGIEYDYDRYGRCSWCEFDYHVSAGDIYIDYDDGSRVRIGRDYQLGDNYFSGSFLDYYTGKWLADFAFTRIDRFTYYAKPGKFQLIDPAEAKKAPKLEPVIE